MSLKTREDILEVYESLIESEVIFFYGNESVPMGEVTDFDINDENIIEIEIDGFQTYYVTPEDFKEYHVKEKCNYHNWPEVRAFDNKLNELI